MRKCVNLCMKSTLFFSLNHNFALWIFAHTKISNIVVKMVKMLARILIDLSHHENLFILFRNSNLQPLEWHTCGNDEHFMLQIAVVHIICYPFCKWIKWNKLRKLCEFFLLYETFRNSSHSMNDFYFVVKSFSFAKLNHQYTHDDIHGIAFTTIFVMGFSQGVIEN